MLCDLSDACEADDKELVDDHKLKALVPYMTGVNAEATQIVLEALQSLAAGGAWCGFHFVDPQKRETHARVGVLYFITLNPSLPLFVFLLSVCVCAYVWAQARVHVCPPV